MKMVWLFERSSASQYTHRYFVDVFSVVSVLVNLLGLRNVTSSQIIIL